MRYTYVAQSELHKIATRPRLMIYNDMIGWALEKIDISTRIIHNSQKIAVGSFQQEHFQVMYKLSSVPNYIYNVAFLMDFDKKNARNMGRTYLS
jgi:hypothetical protein